jgi:hypothetical protein
MLSSNIKTKWDVKKMLGQLDYGYIKPLLAISRLFCGGQI